MINFSLNEEKCNYRKEGSRGGDLVYFKTEILCMQCNQAGYRRWEKTALATREKVVHIMIFFLFSLLSRTTEAKSNTQ